MLNFSQENSNDEMIIVIKQFSSKEIKKSKVTPVGCPAHRHTNTQNKTGQYQRERHLGCMNEVGSKSDYKQLISNVI